MRRISYIMMLLLLLCISTGVDAKPSLRKQYEKTLRSNPGDMDTYCAFVDLLLTEQDTTEAEKHLNYALRLRPTYSCLLIEKSRIAIARNRYEEAVVSYVEALVADTIAIGNPIFDVLADTLSQRMAFRLRVASEKDKSNIASLHALAHLHMQKNDTISALSALSEIWQRSKDSSVLARIEQLEKLRHDSTITQHDSIVAEIPFSRSLTGKIEIRLTVNNLRLKAVLDTTATTSTMSGVETDFMRKNDYLKSEDILDEHTILLRTVSFADGQVQLQDVRIGYHKYQDDSLVLCPQTFEKLGQVRINDEKHVIQLIKKIDDNSH